MIRYEIGRAYFFIFIFKVRMCWGAPVARCVGRVVQDGVLPAGDPLASAACLLDPGSKTDRSRHGCGAIYGSSVSERSGAVIFVRLPILRHFPDYLVCAHFLGGQYFFP
jgi:hypothetical protein